jgi:SRSO17 transposase
MIGMISDIKRKSLPEIAKIVGLKDSQILHHFIANSGWKTEEIREKRIELIKEAIGEREIVLCIDGTGDKKKGKTKKTVYRKSRKNRKWDSSSNSIWSDREYNVSNNV